MWSTFYKAHSAGQVQNGLGAVKSGNRVARREAGGWYQWRSSKKEKHRVCVEIAYWLMTNMHPERSFFQDFSCMKKGDYLSIFIAPLSQYAMHESSLR